MLALTVQSHCCVLSSWLRYLQLVCVSFSLFSPPLSPHSQPLSTSSSSSLIGSKVPSLHSLSGAKGRLVNHTTNHGVEVHKYADIGAELSGVCDWSDSTIDQGTGEEWKQGLKGQRQEEEEQEQEEEGQGQEEEEQGQEEEEQAQEEEEQGQEEEGQDQEEEEQDQEEEEQGQEEAEGEEEQTEGEEERIGENEDEVEVEVEKADNGPPTWYKCSKVIHLSKKYAVCVCVYMICILQPTEVRGLIKGATHHKAPSVHVSWYCFEPIIHVDYEDACIKF